MANGERLDDLIGMIDLDAEAGGECPVCGHERTPPQGPFWFERLLRLKPLPPVCDGTVPDDAWGTRCDCNHPFHGS